MALSLPICALNGMLANACQPTKISLYRFPRTTAKSAPNLLDYLLPTAQISILAILKVGTEQILWSVFFHSQFSLTIFLHLTKCVALRNN